MDVGFRPMISQSFKAHYVEKSYVNALSRTYDLTQNPEGNNSEKSERIGFYQEGCNDVNCYYHVVTGEDLDAAIERKQPHLFIGQSFNNLDKTMVDLYGNEEEKKNFGSPNKIKQ